jgi:hypothetical protein
MNFSEEDMRKVYVRWSSALDKARLPIASRALRQNDIASIIKPSKNSSKIASAIYNSPNLWGKGYTFVIDGKGAAPAKTPADIRRAIGFSVVQNGITYACQTPQFCPPYGRYVDYKTVVTTLMNKAKSSDFADELAEQAFLFISEIHMSENASEVMREIVAFKMDDILRRRKDEGLVTVLSFARPCKEFMGQDILGDEIRQILDACGEHGTSCLKIEKIIKICT